ncbi:MAG: serine/threonine protein kinase [Candidatus Aminicenantes bacterium]|nr:serine/threonine protein kinase [Candidatus Aminicenantes bacterium]
MDTKMPKKGRGKGTTIRMPSGTTRQQGPSVKCPNCRTENPGDSRFCSNCAGPLKEPASGTIKSQTFEVSRGDIFAGRYEIIETLGQGGMGKVFKAYDRKINEVVALKLIRPEIGLNEKAIERFKNELKIARKITHRNICRMHDLGEEGFTHYITMEHVAGEDLKRFIRRAGTLSSGKAIDIAKQVCEGLAEAHRQGVIHRDLKPQNIMIDQDGNAKIMDFGIARFVDTDRMTGSGVMIGTPEYMSPEQAELKDVDKRADIYSLGIVLYEMVSGRVPFDGETPLSIAMKHKTEKPRSVREWNTQVSAELAAVISKCMEKAPGDRFQNAEDLMEDLNMVEQDLSTAERVVPKKKPAPTKEMAVAFQVKKLIVPAAALVVFCIVTLAVLKFLPKKSGAPLLPTATDASAALNMPGQGAVPPSAAPKKKQEDKTGTEPAAKPGSKEVKMREKAVSPAEVAAKKEESITVAGAKTGALEADMESANLAMARATAARAQTQKEGVDKKTVFFGLADARFKEGQRYWSQKSYIDARSVLIISEKLFRTGMERGGDEDHLKTFRKYVENLRGDIEDAKKELSGDKAFESARESEKQGAASLAKKDIENAVKSYVQASVVYQKILLSLRTGKK